MLSLVDMSMTLRKNAKIELLRRVPLFERCSARELGEVAALADELAVPAGKTLAAEGRSGREFLVLVEGAADVRRSGRRVNRLGAGDFLGEIALVTGRPRTATVTTTEPSRVLVLTARDFRRLLEGMPQIAAKVLAALGERLPAD
jgi:CRP/FNR family transcriptional regulator, cyclic AMP receptor protein